jgi:hypothetical protein
MTRSLTVKREIRTLGLDICNPHRLVGAVVRGGTFLDGVAVFPSNAIPNSKSIAFGILRTRFFPELRLVMTHDPSARLDTKVIERMTGLPVIEVESVSSRKSERFKPYKVGRRELQANSTLPPRTVQEILSTTWTTGMLPEPLRIAHLVSRSRFSRENMGFRS